MMLSLAASRITTFPAPPILELKKQSEEQKEQQDSAPSPPAVLSLSSPTTRPSPSLSATPPTLLTPSIPPAAESKTADIAEAVWATEEEDVAPPVVAPRKLGLSLRLSNAETVEDAHAADIQVNGAEPSSPPFGLKLKLTVASADEDSTPQIATTSDIQSARRTIHH